MRNKGFGLYGVKWSGADEGGGLEIKSNKKVRDR